MKKKVLIIHSGVGPYRIGFFEELSHRIPVHLLFYCKSIIAHQTDAAELNIGSESSMEWCIEKRQVKWRPFSTLWQVIPRLIRTLCIYRPGMIVTTEYSPISAVAALMGRLLGSKVVLWTDDSMDNAENSARIRKVQRAVLFILVHRLIVINPEVARYYRKIFKGDIFTSLLLQPEEPIREQLFSEKTTIHAEEFILWHSVGQSKVILFVGRLCSDKNLTYLLRVFAEITVKLKEDVRLVLVGGGPEEEKLRALAEKLGLKEKVIFAGHQPRDAHLWAWFRLAGLFVLPSLHERFGAVVNEALICGIPVLCSKHAGASCLIENSLMGEVFDPADNQKRIQQVFLSRLNQAGTADELFQKNRPSLMMHHFSETVDQFIEACR